jgi:hypothetical protein
MEVSSKLQAPAALSPGTPSIGGRVGCGKEENYSLILARRYTNWATPTTPELTVNRIIWGAVATELLNADEFISEALHEE